LKCPMCGVLNADDAQSCKFCGFIFEENNAETGSPSMLRSVGTSSQSSSSVGATSGSQEFGETILKSQSQVMYRAKKSILDGTLFLTSKRLVYVPAKSQKNAPEIKESSNEQEMLHSPENISIQIDCIDSTLGKMGFVRPSLVVEWHNPDDPSKSKAEFVQKTRTSRLGEIGNDVNSWEFLIERIKTTGTIDEPESSSQNAPEVPENLNEEILEALADNQWKGNLQTQQLVEEKLGMSLDLDVVEEACKKLVDEGILEQDKNGLFFRKKPAASDSSKK